MKLELIDTGYFMGDGGAMFGPVPKMAWQRRYPADEQNRCALAMRSALVTTNEGRIVLIDNGAGNKHLKKFSYYRFFDLKDLGDELRSRGIEPEQVTDVVLTHLHFDHCGYTTQKDADGNYYLSFPNATHWVGRAQWEYALHPHPIDEGSYFDENIVPVSDAGKLRLLDEDIVLCPGIELRLYGGHTPGQIVPYITTAEGTSVFAGDVIPLAASLSPAWISAYDIQPTVSYDEKLRLLEEAKRKKQTIIFGHDAHTVSKCVSPK